MTENLLYRCMLFKIAGSFYISIFLPTTVSLENVLSDINELDKGMEMTKKEYEARKERDHPLILKDFVGNAEDKIKKLKADAKSAQVRHICVQW